MFESFLLFYEFLYAIHRIPVDTNLHCLVEVFFNGHKKAIIYVIEFYSALNASRGKLMSSPNNFKNKILFYWHPSFKTVHRQSFLQILWHHFSLKPVSGLTLFFWDDNIQTSTKSSHKNYQRFIWIFMAHFAKYCR